jgi:fumarate hydratase class I
MAKKGKTYIQDDDAEWLSRDFNTYQERNLRYSQIVPISMFEEKIQVLIYPRKLIFILKRATYEFCFSKGGGSANKTYLYQQTKSLLNEKSMDAFRLQIMDWEHLLVHHTI